MKSFLKNNHKILTHSHWASPSHSTTSQTQSAQSEAPRMPWMQSNQLAVLSQHCDQAAEETKNIEKIDSPLSSSDKAIIPTINLCKSLGTFYILHSNLLYLFKSNLCNVFKK